MAEDKDDNVPTPRGPGLALKILIALVGTVLSLLALSYDKGSFKPAHIESQTAKIIEGHKQQQGYEKRSYPSLITEHVLTKLTHPDPWPQKKQPNDERTAKKPDNATSTEEDPNTLPIEDSRTLMESATPDGIY